MRKVELSLQERRRGRKFSTVGRLHPRFLREERLGENGGAFFNGKEGRVGFRKNNNIMMNNFNDIKVAVTSTGTIPVWIL